MRQVGFDLTTDELLDGIDLSGKRILVTGTSAGLGLETARALAVHGASVVGAVRNLQKAHAATDIVLDEIVGVGSLDLVEIDLASLKSVRAAADSLLTVGKPFDIIIANAGLMACPEGRTVDGFETQFGTNHLGHFVFVNRLVSLLRSESRIVILSSAGHRLCDVDLDDPNFDCTPYDKFIAYGRAKTANCQFAVGLNDRLHHRGVSATAVAPGYIQTELFRYRDPKDVQRRIDEINAHYPAEKPFFRWKSISQGAATTIWCAVVASADEIGGRYCEDCHVAGLNDDSKAQTGVRSYALDRSCAVAQKRDDGLREILVIWFVGSISISGNNHD